MTALVEAIDVADIDADGQAEIAVAYSDSSIAVMKWDDGSGQLHAVQEFTVEGDLSSVTLADVNRDNLGDVIYGGMTEETYGSPLLGIRIAGGQGGVWDGTFAPWATHIDETRPQYGYMNILVSDFNGDGVVELITGYVRVAEPTVVILRVTAGGTDQGEITQVEVPSPYLGFPVELVDLDGDGALDLAARYGSAIVIHRGEPSATAESYFSRSALYAGVIGGAGAFTFGDINADTHIDVVMTDNLSNRFYTNSNRCNL